MNLFFKQREVRANLRDFIIEPQERSYESELVSSKGQSFKIYKFQQQVKKLCLNNGFWFNQGKETNQFTGAQAERFKQNKQWLVCAPVFLISLA